MGNKGNDLRKKPYRNSILRLIYLYRCFEKKELANILKIGNRTLDNETSIFKELLDGKYSIRRKNNDGGRSVKAEGEDYVSVNRLWEVYDLQSETTNILNKAKEYGNFLDGIKDGIKNDEIDDEIDYEKFIDAFLYNIFDKCVYPSMNENLLKKRSEAARNDKYAHEEYDLGVTAYRNRLSELCDMGVINKDKDFNEIIDNEIEKMLDDGEVEYSSLYNLICYSMHFLHPAIYGYRLLKLVGSAAEKDKVLLTEPYIKYLGYQAQSILSNDKCIDILDCIKNRKLLKFNYLKNPISVIEYDEGCSKEISEILPYKLLYDTRYGRYYMLGFDLKTLLLGRFKVEFMENLSASDKSLKKAAGGLKKEEIEKKMDEVYHEYYEGTWTSRGLSGESDCYRKITFLRRFIDEDRKPVPSDYERYLSCTYSGFNESDGTYYIIIPDYLDIKTWVMEHSVADGVGWFEVVGDEPVVRDDDNWVTTTDVKADDVSFIDNLSDTFMTMEKYYDLQ